MSFKPDPPAQGSASQSMSFSPDSSNLGSKVSFSPDAAQAPGLFNNGCGSACSSTAQSSFSPAGAMGNPMAMGMGMVGSGMGGMPGFNGMGGMHGAGLGPMGAMNGMG